MLQTLYIDNYALIDNLKIDFQKGLSIITGETGAGKSILLGALSLIIGKRADTNVLFDKSKKCIVEATFSIKDYKLESFFSSNELDYENHTVIRREINAAGKSRAFINDTPVTLEVLNDLTTKLIDIHSQHENLRLNDNKFQLNIIDKYGNHQDYLDDYKEAFSGYKRILKEFEELSDTSAKLKADYDYLSFQFNQLEEAKITENEQEELELELERLNHAEEIKQNLQGATSLFISDEDGILSRLKLLQGFITKLSKYLPEIPDLFKRLESSVIEIKDISDEIESLNTRISVDPERAAVITQRLDLLYSLQQKHNVRSVNELLEVKSKLREKLDTISTSDDKLGELEKELNKLHAKIKIASETLTKHRINKFKDIEQKVTGMLSDMGIQNAGFQITRQELNDFYPEGKDMIQYLFSANKNTPLLEISKIASGGELSRFMLSIKSLISHSSGLPTILFDEIDTGVSGEIADKVGNIIKNMSKDMQVINITHLPQIAGKGDYHYLVYKKENETSSKTFIKLLNSEERLTEIAKMLSGKELTEAALENARELLKN